MSLLHGKSVVICDYPSKYTFPPNGYGGIERWLWTVAVESVNLGMRVILLGPQWKNHLLPQAEYFSDSIIDIETDDFLTRIGCVDFLIGGHEYWFDQEKLDKFDQIAKFSLTYQHGSLASYQNNTFNNKNRFLFCYSDEIMRLFSFCHPTKLLCVAAGVNEQPVKRRNDGYLISIGRIDADKSQHYVILAARNLNLPIYILGEDVKKDGYFEKYKHIFNMPHVHMMGIVSERDKMDLIAGACCGVYTIGSQYIEPAAGTIAEIIRSGVPLAGISWKGNDAVCEPIKIDSNLGRIAKCDKNDNEDDVVKKLTKAIRQSIKLDRNHIFNKGNKIYDAKSLVEKMYLRTFNIQ